jgi:hypothetical protein
MLKPSLYTFGSSATPTQHNSVFFMQNQNSSTEAMHPQWCTNLFPWRIPIKNKVLRTVDYSGVSMTGPMIHLANPFQINPSLTFHTSRTSAVTWILTTYCAECACAPTQHQNTPLNVCAQKVAHLCTWDQPISKHIHALDNMKIHSERQSASTRWWSHSRRSRCQRIRHYVLAAKEE